MRSGKRSSAACLADADTSTVSYQDSILKITLRKQNGFTLIELMITVAIVAILASIALPSYQSHVTSMRRTTAQACLLELTQFTERYYSTRMSYVDATLPASECTTNLTGHYSFAFASAPTATAYAITATATGAQAIRDAGCTPMQVTQTGARTPSSGCWK